MKMEQLFESAEIRTALLLISLARRDFERGASSDKPPRINQATADPPSRLSPPSSAFLLAISLALKLLLAFSWKPALSQSGKSNCCLHREPLSPSQPNPSTSAELLLLQWHTVTWQGIGWTVVFTNASWSTAVFPLPRKNFIKFQFFILDFLRTCCQDKNRPPLLFFERHWQ